MAGRSANNLLNILSGPRRTLTAQAPETFRQAFNFSPPPKWSAAVPEMLVATFGRQLVGKRPEIYLQAFVDTSFARGGGCVCNTELASLGGSLLQLYSEEVTAKLATMPADLGNHFSRSVVLDILNGDDTLGATMNHVWKLSSLILTDRGVEGLGTLYRGATAVTLKEQPVPLITAATSARALVAAVYLNTSLDECSKFIHDHVTKPTSTVAGV
jgi:dsRNA-specific ribonuclease